MDKLYRVSFFENGELVHSTLFDNDEVAMQVAIDLRITHGRVAYVEEAVLDWNEIPYRGPASGWTVMRANHD